MEWTGGDPQPLGAIFYRRIVDWLDMDVVTGCQPVGQIETLGPGFVLRSHENLPYVWADIFFGPNRDAMRVIDKQTLEEVKRLPMKKPSGKYNVWNKIAFEDGTSH